MGLTNWWAWSPRSVPVSAVTSPLRVATRQMVRSSATRLEVGATRPPGDQLHAAPHPVYDAVAQAVGIPHGPPEERPLPTSRSDLTSPAPRLKERYWSREGRRCAGPPGPRQA